MGNPAKVNRILMVKKDMTPQEVQDSILSTPLQSKLANVFDSNGDGVYSQREADVFNATLIKDKGEKGISLMTRYQDGTVKETQYVGDLADFKFAPKGEVKPYESCTCPDCMSSMTGKSIMKEKEVKSEDAIKQEMEEVKKKVVNYEKTSYDNDNDIRFKGYDKQGQLVHYVQLRATDLGFIRVDVTKEYDDQGRVIKAITTVNGKVDDVVTTEYDE